MVTDASADAEEKPRPGGGVGVAGPVAWVQQVLSSTYHMTILGFCCLESRTH